MRPGRSYHASRNGPRIKAKRDELGFNQEAVARAFGSRIARLSRRSKPASARSRPRSSCASPNVRRHRSTISPTRSCSSARASSPGGRAASPGRPECLRARCRTLWSRSARSAPRSGSKPPLFRRTLGLTGRSALRGRQGGGRALRGGVRAGRCACAAPGRGDGPRSRHPGADGRRGPWRLGRRLPFARAGRRANQPPRGAGPPALRPRPRAVPFLTWDLMPPEQVEEASPSSGAGRATRRQFRHGAADAAPGSTGTVTGRPCG